MNRILAEPLQWEMEPDYDELNVNELVKNASKVIVPLGPITTFAARSPWSGLEEQTFEAVARRLKSICDIDIYPNDSLLKSAWKRGEIKPDFLEDILQHWLDEQFLEMPRKDALQYCRSRLMQEEQQPYGNPVSSSELQSIARKLSRFQSQFAKSEAVQTYSQRVDKLGGEGRVQELNRHMIKWCKLFLDESQAVWKLPNSEAGFYQAWQKLIQYDPALKLRFRKQLKDMPKKAELALKQGLSALEIPHSEIQAYIEAHLLALPGWAGMMLWRSQQSAGERSLLTDYLAVRILMEFVLIKDSLPLPKERTESKLVLESLILKWKQLANLPISSWAAMPSTEQKARLKLAFRFDSILVNRLWLEAWEKTYEEQLKKIIIGKQSIAVNETKPPKAQFAFCIDVRSESFRRQLEKVGPFETIGTAGFYGLPIETCELTNTHSHSSLPVMFKPQFKVNEFATGPDLRQYQQRRQTAISVSSTFHMMKHNLLSSMVLPEISGPWLSLQTLIRSLLPGISGYTLRKLREKWLKKPAVKLSIDRIHSLDSGLPAGFSEDEKVHYAGQALKMMGLTDHFSPLVVICGHGSHSTNNPYRSALECGACGGASSSFNARVLAELCNLPNVRKALAAKEEIFIPNETVFAAAEHVTSLDELKWIYVPELSPAARGTFEMIQARLPKVSEGASAERISHLPNIGTPHKNLKAEVQRLTEDWSEVRPEWGLARNAAFIIGERTLTQGCDLEGRVFLQNYSWEKDKNGMLLTNIISGPATVAQWINLQYYASTVAPHYYGSGNKATQTVTAGLGVMQGNASDLLAGLPWQSVMKSDQEAYHAPLRLLVVIQAPKDYVKRLLEKQSAFRQKLKNGWIRLVSIGPDGHWERWS